MTRDLLLLNMLIKLRDLTLPHIQIEYSANIEALVDMAMFCDHMRRAAIETGILPMPGIRVRAIKATHVAIADGDPAHGFIDIALRLRGGRPDAAKTAATEQIFATARDFLAPVLATQSMALSFEMRDIDPELSPKTSTIRDHLKGPSK